MKFPTVPLSLSPLPVLGLILLSSSFAAIPMLQPFLFAFDDIHHLYRLWELDQLMQQGTLYTRWAPDLFFGYGSPVFHYNSPLPYYPGVALHRLGLSYVDSLRLLFWLGLPLSGFAMYAWARQHLGRGLSLFASLLYMYAPYHLLEIYLRGALPEFLAFIWFPLILLAARGVIAGRGLGWAPLLALGYAALILTHNLSAYLFFPALILYCALLWSEQRHRGVSVLTSLAVALGLAAGLSAFYALPALAERELVLFGRLLGNLPEHLFPAQTLVSGAFIHDYAITSAPEDLRGIRLGLVQFLLLLAGAVAWLARGTPPPTRRAGAWALVLVAGGLFLMQPTAQIFWETVPLANLVQFPWRLLALLALAGALLGALGTQWMLARLRPAWRGIAYISLAALVILSSLLGLETVRTTLAAEQVSSLGKWELELGYGLASGSSGREYVPVWVATEPVPPTADPVALLDEAATSHYRAEPPDTWVELLERRGNLFRYRVRAREPVQLTLNHVYFPGWVAEVHGREVPVEASTPEGLAFVSLPAGGHVLELRFAETPLRPAPGPRARASAWPSTCYGARPARRRRTTP